MTPVSERCLTKTNNTQGLGVVTAPARAMVQTLLDLLILNLHPTHTILISFTVIALFEFPVSRISRLLCLKLVNPVAAGASWWIHKCPVCCFSTDVENIQTDAFDLLTRLLLES